MTATRIGASIGFYNGRGRALTVGVALWPEQLSDQERAWLDPGVPAHLDRRAGRADRRGGIVGVATAVACTRAQLGSIVLLESDRLGSGASGGAGRATHARGARWRGSAGAAQPGPLEPHRLAGPRTDLAARRRSAAAGLAGTRASHRAVHRVSRPAARGGALTAEQVDALLPGPAPGPAGRAASATQARLNPLRALARLAAGLAISRAASGAGRVDRGWSHTFGETRPASSGRAPWCCHGHTAADRRSGPDHPVRAKSRGTCWSPSRPACGCRGGGAAGHVDRRWPPHGRRYPRHWRSRARRPTRGHRRDVADMETAWPASRGIRVAHQWACFRPAHPDLLPVIDRIPGR